MFEQTTAAATTRNIEEKVADELCLDIEIVKAAKMSEGELTTVFNKARHAMREVNISLGVFLTGAVTMFLPAPSISSLSVFVFTAGALMLGGGLLSAMVIADTPDYLRDDISKTALAGQCKAYNKTSDAPSAAPS
jgi:hypothetical protein